jgi:uncharacterized protein YjbI with pentapeptide repeats
LTLTALARVSLGVDVSLVGGANLRGADLTGVNLGGANLAGVNLAGAYLAGVNLAGAYLAGAVHLTQLQVDFAYGDQDTKLPPGIRRPDSWKPPQG